MTSYLCLPCLVIICLSSIGCNGSLSQIYDFSSKVVIITGASSGVGESIAKLFSSYGAKLTLTGRSAKSLARVVAECEQLSPTKTQINQVVGDFTNETVVQQVIKSTIDKFGKLDVLINNAGGTKPAPLFTENESNSVTKLMEIYDYTFKLNVRAPLLLMALAVPHLEKSKGTIINVSSIAGFIALGDPWIAYSMSKGALDMMTKNGAVILAKKGIRVNSINPGPTETNFFRMLSPNMSDEQLKAFYVMIGNMTLMDRVVQPDEIAPMAAFLASNQATFVTGSLFTIDGGCTVKAALNMH